MFEFYAPSRKPLIIPLFIPNLGCKNRCAFCDQTEITGAAKQPTLADVEKSVANYLGWSKKRERIELSFYGGTFTALPENQMMGYVQKGVEFVKNKKISALRCSTRPDAIDEFIVGILKENYFETVELGVQSTSDELLEKMKRGHDSKAIFDSVNLLKKNGILVGAQLMTGYPEESWEDIEITRKSLATLKPDFIRIYPFIPLKKSYIVSRIEAGSVKMSNPQETIEKSVDLFLEAMKLKIPVIRIGLPAIKTAPEIYPANLLQVVVQKSIERLARQGISEFQLPQKWQTGFYMAKKNFPNIQMVNQTK